MIKNGSGQYVILCLYVDSSKSGECWKKRIKDEHWNHDVQHFQIRDVFFEILEKYGLETPIEKIYSEETGELISDTCFNISIVDLAYWQEYWTKNDR